MPRATPRGPRPAAHAAHAAHATRHVRATRTAPLATRHADGAARLAPHTSHGRNARLSARGPSREFLGRRSAARNALRVSHFAPHPSLCATRLATRGHARQRQKPRAALRGGHHVTQPSRPPYRKPSRCAPRSQSTDQNKTRCRLTIIQTRKARKAPRAPNNRCPLAFWISIVAFRAKRGFPRAVRVAICTGDAAHSTERATPSLSSATVSESFALRHAARG